MRICWYPHTDNVLVFCFCKSRSSTFQIIIWFASYSYKPSHIHVQICTAHHPLKRIIFHLPKNRRVVFDEPIHLYLILVLVLVLMLPELRMQICIRMNWTDVWGCKCRSEGGGWSGLLWGVCRYNRIIAPPQKNTFFMSETVAVVRYGGYLTPVSFAMRNLFYFRKHNLFATMSFAIYDKIRLQEVK